MNVSHFISRNTRIASQNAKCATIAQQCDAYGKLLETKQGSIHDGFLELIYDVTQELLVF